MTALPLTDPHRTEMACSSLTPRARLPNLSPGIGIAWRTGRHSPSSSASQSIHPPGPQPASYCDGSPSPIFFFFLPRLVTAQTSLNTVAAGQQLVACPSSLVFYSRSLASTSDVRTIATRLERLDGFNPTCSSFCSPTSPRRRPPPLRLVGVTAPSSMRTTAPSTLLVAPCPTRSTS